MKDKNSKASKDLLVQQIDIINKVAEGKLKWKHLQEFRADNNMTSYTASTLRVGSILMREYIHNDMLRMDTDSIPHLETTSRDEQGNLISEKKITILKSDLFDPRKLIEAHGLDPKKWKLLNYQHSSWEQNSKSDGLITLEASKIKVGPITSEEAIFDVVEKYFSSLDTKLLKKNIVPSEYSKNGEILEICIPDLHLGLSASEEETGILASVETTKKDFYHSLSDICNRMQGRKFEKIILVLLGDFLHVDTYAKTTTKGTPQDAHLLTTQIFSTGLDLLTETIEILAEYAPLDVVVVSGNHDKVLGQCVAYSVEKLFKKCKTIDVDYSPNPLKYRKYGNVLLGWTHGNMSKDNMRKWLQSHARTEYGETRYAEIHSGHHHTQQTTEDCVIIRHLPTLCRSSAWEHSSGYSKHERSTMSFVWNKKTGLREIWYSNAEKVENE